MKESLVGYVKATRGHMGLISAGFGVFLFLFFTMFIKQVSLSSLGEGWRFGR